MLDFTMKSKRFIATFFFATFFILGIAHSVGIAAEDASNKDKALLCSVPIPKNGEVIVLPLTIAGKQMLFVLDTGASMSVFDKSIKDILKTHVGAKTFGTAKDTITADIYEPPPVQLGRSVLRMGESVACIELSDIRKATGLEIRGILGMDSLKHYIVQIDFDAGQAAFWSSEKEPELAWGTPFPLYNRQTALPGLPIISIVIDNVAIQFLVDTGNDGGIGMKKYLIEELRFNHELGAFANRLKGTTAGGELSFAQYTMKLFTLGSFEHKNLICLESNRNLIGLSYLSRYRVTFDFPQEKMYLAKGHLFQQSDHPDMSGLHILRENGDTFVDSIDPDSPGERAGIRLGDRILQINRQEAAGISLFDLRNMLKSGNKKKISLTIGRGEKVEEKVIELQESVLQWDDAVKR
jgi:hypothetical protein